MSIFSKKDKVALDLQSISTLVSEGCVIDGNIKAPAYVRIDGQVTGDVTVAEGLILGEKGSITGNVITKDLVVYGIIDGNLRVSALEIRSTGKVTGEIITQSLAVESGAVYNGSLSMTQSTKPAHSNKPDSPIPQLTEVAAE